MRCRIDLCSANLSTGFTLVEILVALAVFALLATAGLGLLSFAFDTKFSDTKVLIDMAFRTARARALYEEFSGVYGQADTLHVYTGQDFADKKTEELWTLPVGVKFQKPFEITFRIPGEIVHTGDINLRFRERAEVLQVDGYGFIE